MRSFHLLTHVVLVLSCVFSLGFEWEGRLGRLERQFVQGDVEGRRAAVRRMGGYAASDVGEMLMRALEDPDEAVRREAARAAGQVQLIDAVGLLSEWLDDLEPESREAAAAALGAIGDPRPIPSLVRALGDASASVRIAAVLALAQINVDEVVVPLLGRLDDDDTTVRVAAALALGRVGDRRAVVPLIGRGRDAPEVRLAAVTALGLLADPRGSAALIGALREDDEPIRLAAISALGQLGSTRGLAPLVEMAHAPSTRTAVAAVAAIGVIDGEEVSEALLDLLPRANIRTAVIRALIPRSDAGLTMALVHRLDEGSIAQRISGMPLLHDRLALLAEPSAAPFLLGWLRAGREDMLTLDALAYCGDPAVLVRLLVALEHAPMFALVAIEHYFERHPADPRAADPLLVALSSVPATLRVRVIRLLGKVGAGRAAGALIPLTRVDDDDVQRAALNALRELGQPGSSEVFFEHLAGENPQLRLEAAEGLASAMTEAEIPELLNRLEAPPPVDRHALLVALAGGLSRLSLDARQQERTHRILSGFLASGDESLMDRAIRTLSAWPDESALTLLAEIRSTSLVSATLALGEREDGRRLIRERLSSSRTEVVAAAAVRAGRYGPEMVEPLLLLLREGAWPVPAAASFSLLQLASEGHVEREAAAEVLCDRVQARDPALRANLLLILASLAVQCDDVPIADWTGRAHAPAVRAAAHQYLAVHVQGESDTSVSALQCEDDVDERVRLLCGRVSSENVSTEPLRLFVYDRTDVLLSHERVSIWLSDGSTLVLRSDAGGQVSLGDAPAGPVTIGRAIYEPLEPSTRNEQP